MYNRSSILRWNVVHCTSRNFSIVKLKLTLDLICMLIAYLFFVGASYLSFLVIMYCLLYWYLHFILEFLYGLVSYVVGCIICMIYIYWTSSNKRFLAKTIQEWLFHKLFYMNTKYVFFNVFHVCILAIKFC